MTHVAATGERSGSGLHDVVVAGIANTVQARALEGHTSLTITLDAALAALADAGMTVGDVDGVIGMLAMDVIYSLGMEPVFHTLSAQGIPAVIEAASLIAAGVCNVVLVATGSAGVYTERASTAPWTRPNHEFVAPFGMFTAAEFALIARRHMHLHGTTPEQLATVSTTIRNNGHVNPEAVYYGRGPFTVDDVLASRMVADPFHLLDCAMTSEGGCALVLTRVDRAADLPAPPVYVLGGSSDRMGPSYRHPPSWDLTGRDPSGIPNGYVGRGAARRAFATAGIGVRDVDVCELYDPFSFEIIRQLEAFELCGPGEGGPFVLEGNIGPGGRYPVTTDGGTMAFSHGGATVQLLQRVIRGVQQLRGTCASAQVPGAEVALCSGGGAGALFTDVLVLGASPAGTPRRGPARRAQANTPKRFGVTETRIRCAGDAKTSEATELAPQGPGIPLPEPTPISQPFWDGCARGELWFQRCPACERALFDPAPLCRWCGGRELRWERSAGIGSVYSWTVVWRPQTPSFHVPYAPAIVDVDEGFQILSDVIGCAPDDVRVGLRVEVDFHPVGSGFALPYFRPLAAGPRAE